MNFQIAPLMKVLKSIPTPKCNIIELERDVVEFTSKLSVIEMLSSEEQKIENEVDIHLSKQ